MLAAFFEKNAGGGLGAALVSAWLESKTRPVQAPAGLLPFWVAPSPVAYRSDFKERHWIFSD